MEKQIRQIAIIDCGTNIFNLLIAEISNQHFKCSFNDKIAVRLGENLSNTQNISEDAIERGVKGIVSFQNEIKKRDIVETVVIGTSALRDAKNSNVFLEKVKEATTYSIQIIDGKKEAELIYKGVKKAFDMGKSKCLIVDIGGGSTEFIIANDERIFWKKSYQLGVIRIWDKFKPNDPLTVEDISRIEKFLWNELEELRKALLENPCERLIGSSGSFETLADLINFKNNPEHMVEEENTFYHVSSSDFLKMHMLILRSNSEERSKMKGMLEMRIKTIVISSILVHLIVEGFKFDKIHISSYSLKEGILAEKIAGNI